MSCPPPLHAASKVLLLEKHARSGAEPGPHRPARHGASGQWEGDGHRAQLQPRTALQMQDVSQNHKMK